MFSFTKTLSILKLATILIIGTLYTIKPAYPHDGIATSVTLSEALGNENDIIIGSVGGNRQNNLELQYVSLSDIAVETAATAEFGWFFPYDQPDSSGIPVTGFSKVLSLLKSAPILGMSITTFDALIAGMAKLVPNLTPEQIAFEIVGNGCHLYLIGVTQDDWDKYYSPVLMPLQIRNNCMITPLTVTGEIFTSK